MDSANYIDIVLIGGGHAHAQVIKMWGMKPLAGVRLSLISPSSFTPYSGMLPGLVAGHYTFEQSHIDLRRLCHWAGVRYINDRAVAIDSTRKAVILASQPDLPCDFLSINNGITPDLSIEGAKEFAIGVKPISNFYQQWQTLLQQEACMISVVGAGIAGIELSLAMAERLRKENKAAKIQLIYPQKVLLPDAPQKLRQHLEVALQSYDVECLPGHRVNQFTADTIKCENDDGEHLNLNSDFHLLCTQAKPSGFAQESGLKCDEQGFILLNDALQSISHPWIFAAGDTAQQQNHPRPQAGVFAVRQGPILFKNLRRIAKGKKLRQYTPQQEFLKIISLGKKSAAASRGQKAISRTGLSAALVWNWKNHIDQKFMARFQKLPKRDMKKAQGSVTKLALPEESLLPAMHCEGCGAKVAADDLKNILQELSHSKALDTKTLTDDAARLSLPDNYELLQTVDSFHGLVSDPYEQGRIACLHAMSDIFAMGAKVHSAQAMISIAHAGENIVKRDLKRLLQGILYELERHHAQLVGGHSSLGDRNSIGLVVNGYSEPENILFKNALRAGDDLILTKALGSGIAFAAEQHGLAKGPWIDATIEQMLQSNYPAAQLAHEFKVRACTDITGFGLAGHLLEMLDGSALCAALDVNTLPLLEGVDTLLEREIRSSLFPQNMRNIRSHIDGKIPDILADPQTSGGLLIAVSAGKSDALLDALKEQGYHHSVRIGHIKAKHRDHIELL
ncbi:selenide, water dikinase SelD [Pseudoteredinibacter isoporae]|uniref:Selenide,water dikinase n=1 Tax=Pseudoteredinibacter isoporae TaxID=570281 RepID=A0A7X0MV11_9GAMM|nr:selenide, water dikinase SelD [Pseudoteredinibacter isoporae]MBB6520590.1 selenide,water dikinase [Pseudoteredinibacter isoporae]NHO86157.1 selenide, water dikinase SelD [Pseudoteredinibacter isoporae]NIB25392.1 selenide, water dikinase SelD [Pseudoteredinibacter isoporae]